MAIIEYNDEQGVPKNISKMEYLKFIFGNNKVRLVPGNPITFYQHRFLDATYEKEGEIKQTKRNVICLGKDKCPICAKIGDNKEHPNRASKTNVRYVIDRNDNSFKIMDYGTGVRDGIQALFKNVDKVDEKGTPFDYDIIVIKQKGEADKVSYNVQDAKRVPLTADEQEAIANLVPLTERYKENTLEEIQAMNLLILQETPI